MVLEYHRDILRRDLCLTTEERHDGLRRIIVHIVVVESVEQVDLLGCRQVDIDESFLSEETFQHRFIALEQLRNQLTRILIAVILGLGVVLAVHDEDLEVERRLERTIY